MMKKAIALMMMLVVLVGLCACGSKPTVSLPAESLEPAPEVTLAPTEEPAPAPETQPTEEAETVPVGEVERTDAGSSYRNEALGIGIDLDNGWAVATEEQLAQIAGIAEQSLSEQGYSAAVSQANLYYDLYAQRLDGLATMNMNYEKLADSISATLTEEQYVELAKPLLESVLASSGLTDAVIEKNTVVLAGVEHFGVAFHGTKDGQPYFAQQVCMKVGNRMAVLTLESFQEDITQDLAAQFYALG